MEYFGVFSGYSDEVSYEQTIEDDLSFIPQIIQNRANLIGGCCGTSPEYNKRMAEIIQKTRSYAPSPLQVLPLRCFSSDINLPALTISSSILQG